MRVTLVRNGVPSTGEFRDTNASGEYLFENLEPGIQYSVEFNLTKYNTDNTTNYRFTQQDNLGSDDANDSDANPTTGRASGQTPVVVSSDANLSFDAGIYLPIIVGDYVWLDKNADGVQDGNELGIDGVLVTLIIDGVVHADINTTTAGGGAYLFNASYDLKPDHNYSVQFTAPDASYFFTTQNSASTTDLLDSDADVSGQGVAATPTMFSGEQNLTLDAGLYQKAALGNRVWVDKNGNGIQDSNETGEDNVTVNLYQDCNGSIVATQQTAGGGLYHFEGLRPGDYCVEFTNLPPNYVFTQYKQGVDTTDSDVNTTSNRSDIVTLSSGDDNNDTDAGIYLPVNIGDRIWHDKNADGIQDGTELNITVDVNVTLSNGTNTYTTTAVNGAYLFPNVLPDTGYTITFDMPTGYDSVSPKGTTNDNNDSDVNPLTRVTDAFNVVSGVDQVTWDMGVYNTASIGDRIWLDRNLNGIQEAEDINYTGSIDVTLFDANGTQIGTQNTVTGSYLFTGLVPSDYYVTFTLPTGYVLSPKNVGGDINLDSDVNSTLRTDVTMISSGENDLSWDMGIGLIDFNLTKVQSGGVPTVTAVGDVIVYTITVENNGTVTLTDINTTEFYPGAGAGTLSAPVSSDGNTTVINVNQTWTYTANYTATQSDIDLGVNLVNIVTVDTNETQPNPPKEDNASTPVVQNPDFNLTKVQSGGANPVSVLGDVVIYKITIENNGTTTLRDINITEFYPRASNPGTLTLVSQSINADNNIDVGEIWEYNATYTAIQADLDAGVDLVNVVKVDTNETGPKEDNATTPVLENPIISLQKATNGVGADAVVDAVVLNVGDPVTWTYEINNTGNVPLVNINLTDNQEGQITCPFTTLAVGASMTCTQNGIAVVGNYENIAIVTGVAPSGQVVDDNDPSHYVVVAPPLGQPAIDIQKATNGVDADNAIDAVVLNAGDAVTWSYVVRNTGNVNLTDINVTDDREGQVVCPDINLSVGASMTCTSKVGIAAVGNYENIANVVGTPPSGFDVNASDPSHYRVTDINATNASIDVEKATNGIDADLVADAVELTQDDNVTWTYVVRNTGNVDLNVTLTDDIEGLITCPKAQLAVGEFMLCTQSGIVAAAGTNYVNIATVIGTPPSGSDVNDTDPSHYHSNPKPVPSPTASLGNLVWYDYNANGLQDQYEDPVANVRVYLLNNAGVRIQDANGTDIFSDTNVTGEYIFDGLIPNFAYGAEFDLATLPAGFASTTIFGVGYADINETKDSDADWITGITDSVPLVADQNYTDLDMGIIIAGGNAHIGDYFWIDSNSNGKQDVGEEVVVGGKVELLDNTGTPILDLNNTGIIIVGADGRYGFDVLPGNYQVRFTIPSAGYDGYVFTSRLIGGNPTVDSNVGSRGLTQAITVVQGQNLLTFDAGINCGCGNVSTDGTDALSLWGLIGMMLMTLSLGLYFVREEEKFRLKGKK